MKTTVILSPAAVLATGCRSSATTTAIPDASLGLAKGSLFDVPTMTARRG